MLNSSANNPRSIVKLNGKPIGGFTNWEVENNVYYEADRFSVSYPQDALPTGMTIDDMIELTTPVEDADGNVLDLPPLLCEIFAGFPQNYNAPTSADMKRWILGRVDDITYNPAKREVVISGRDLTSFFIDNKTDLALFGTASEVVAGLAASHGLTVTHITPTVGDVSDVFKNADIMTDQQRTEWDIITYLAGVAAFVAYVDGNDMHFEPAEKITNPYVIEIRPPDKTAHYARGDVKDTFTFMRNLTVLRAVVVTVRCWDTVNGRRIIQRYPIRPQGISPGGAKIPEQNYYVNDIQCKDSNEAQQKAQSIYKSIVAHQVRMSFDMAADNILSRAMPIQVVGTGTKFDQTYNLDRITRSFSIQDGYTMKGSAKNTTVEDQAGL